MAMRHELGRDEKPVCLMDMGTIGAKWLKKNGVLNDSGRIGGDQRLHRQGQGRREWRDAKTGSSCSRTRPITTPPRSSRSAARPPASAAASATRCSGRSYVYQAMRVTGAADPTVPIAQTLEGKLPQRKLVTTAAARLLLLRQPDRPGHRSGR
ncbi:MAG: hypothetical protein ACLUUF_06045 [Bifidobacterium pullorum]